jgi:hypothetical protein
LHHGSGAVEDCRRLQGRVAGNHLGTCGQETLQERHEKGIRRAAQPDLDPGQANGCEEDSSGHLDIYEGMFFFASMASRFEIKHYRILEGAPSFCSFFSFFFLLFLPLRIRASLDLAMSIIMGHVVVNENVTVCDFHCFAFYFLFFIFYFLFFFVLFQTFFVKKNSFSSSCFFFFFLKKKQKERKMKFF